MAENNNEKIQRLHRELLKAKKILGEKVIDEILHLLCEGDFYKGGFEALDNQKRDVAASYLGMDRENYEKMLGGKPHKAKKKIDDKKTLKKFLGLGG